MPSIYLLLPRRSLHNSDATMSIRSNLTSTKAIILALAALPMFVTAVTEGTSSAGISKAGHSIQTTGSIGAD